MIHAVILASIINSAYLAGVPALTDIYSTGFPVTEGCEGWTLPEFVTLTKLEVCMFMRVHVWKSTSELESSPSSRNSYGETYI